MFLNLKPRDKKKKVTKKIKKNDKKHPIGKLEKESVEAINLYSNES